MKKKILAAFIILTLAMSFAGCGETGTNQNSGKSRGKGETAEIDGSGITAYVGTSIFETSGLDPVKGAMSYGYPFINNALIKVNPDSEYVGDLATDWSISKDALTYTFTLREDVKFSDGSDFTADDVVFTYETVKENNANNENVDLTYLKEVKAVNDHKVEFTLIKPYSPFFDMTAMLQIVPKDSYDSEMFETAPIGTGAYKVVQYNTNQQMILEPNEYYYGETPDIDRVTLVYMDEDTAFAAAQSGQLDIAMIGTKYVNEKIEGMHVERFETMDVRNINLPVLPEQTMKDINGKEVKVGNDVTSDKAVREALSIGINRQNIIDHAFNGVGKPAVNFTDNLVWASTDDYEDHRVDEAEKLLDDAGWKDSDGDGIREKDGKKCAFNVYSPGGDDDRYQLAAALAEEAKNLGIEIKVMTAGWDEITNVQNTSGVVWGWGQYSPTVLNSLFNSELFLDGGYDNVSGLLDEKVDAKIKEAIEASSQEDAVAAWKEVQKLADAEYPNLYLVNIEHCYFINDDLDISMDTQIPHPHGHGSPIVCNMADWKISQ